MSSIETLLDKHLFFSEIYRYQLFFLDIASYLAALVLPFPFIIVFLSIDKITLSSSFLHFF